MRIITDTQTYDTYLEHCASKKIEPFSRKDYLRILKLYGKYGGEQLLLGHKIELGGEMGSIYIKRKKVDSLVNKNINWKDSVYDENGKMIKKVYYSDAWRYLFHWIKPMKGGKAVVGMSFKPVKGGVGMFYNWHERLRKILKDDPLAFRRFTTQKKVKCIKGLLNGQVVVKVSKWKELVDIYGYTHSQLKTIRGCAYGSRKEACGYTWEIEYEKF